MKALLLALLLTLPALASDCIFSEEKGSGPEAIVFLHDGLSTHRIWDAQWSHFGTKYHVIRYDRRGYGKSCAPTQKFSDMVDLENLLDARKVEKATFIASSAGGDLALRYTIKHPERVKALVLAGSVASGFPVSEHFIQIGTYNTEPKVKRNDARTSLLRWANDKYMMCPSASKARRAAFRRVRESNPMQTSAEVYKRTNELRENREEPGPAFRRLSEITVPTLLIAGECDTPDIHAQSGAIAAGIKGAKRVVLKDAGHMEYFEQPEAFNKEVEKFIGDL
jgi:pimeloyl-ACP methyl ester carboxylesterase